MSKLGFLDSMKFSISPYENYSDKALLKTIKGFRESIEAGYDDDEIESELKEALLEARSRGLTVSKNPFGWLFGESKPAPEPEINFAEYSDRDLRSTINTYKDYIKADFGGERIVNSLKSAINEAKRRGFTDKSLLKMPTGTEEDLTDNEIKSKIITLKEYIKAGPPYDSPEIRRQLGETIEEAKRRGFTATGLVTANPKGRKIRKNTKSAYKFSELSSRAQNQAIKQIMVRCKFDSDGNLV